MALPLWETIRTLEPDQMFGKSQPQNYFQDVNTVRNVLDACLATPFASAPGPHVFTYNSQSIKSVNV